LGSDFFFLKKNSIICRFIYLFISSIRSFNSLGKLEHWVKKYFISKWKWKSRSLEWL